MLKHIYLILISTFFFGFIAGGVLWLYNHTVDPQEPIIDFDGTDKGLTVSVLAYGGCDSVGCASYQITSDGSYTFIERFRNAPEARSEGELSSGEMRTLRQMAGATNFERLRNTQFDGTCPIAFDGLGYRYTVAYEGEYYSFDSCEEDLRDVAFFEELNQFFGFFQAENRER